MVLTQPALSVWLNRKGSSNDASIVPTFEIGSLLELGDCSHKIFEQTEAHNMLLKSLRALRSLRWDVPFQGSFANGSAILSQTIPCAIRRLTWCYKR